MRAEEEILLLGERHQLTLEVEDSAQGHAVAEPAFGNLFAYARLFAAASTDGEREVDSARAERGRDRGKQVRALHAVEPSREEEPDGSLGALEARLQVRGGEQGVLMGARVEVEQRRRALGGVGLVGRRPVALDSRARAYGAEVGALLKPLPPSPSRAEDGVARVRAHDLPTGPQRVLAGGHEGHASSRELTRQRVLPVSERAQHHARRADLRGKLVIIHESQLEGLVPRPDRDVVEVAAAPRSRLHPHLHGTVPSAGIRLHAAEELARDADRAVVATLSVQCGEEDEGSHGSAAASTAST